MNILFICSRNKWRSRTAETIFSTSQEHVVRSAGTEESVRIRVSAKLIEWADLIFVMEKKHKQRLIQKFPISIDNKELVVLNILDDYKYMDKELIEMLENSVSIYVNLGAAEQ